jgi:hypothetical protein
MYDTEVTVNVLVVRQFVHCEAWLSALTKIKPEQMD